MKELSILPLLKSLSDNLSKIDERFENETKIKVKEANEKFMELKKKFTEIQIPIADDILKDQFKNMFEGFISGVKELESEYLKKTDMTEKTFFDGTLAKVENLKAGEGEKTTRSICMALGDTVAPATKHTCAYGELQKIVRNIGCSDSEDVKKEEAEFKEKMAKLFLDEFRFDYDKCPRPESRRFFSDMAEQLFGNDQMFETLKEAFLSISAFKLDETKGITKVLFNEKAEKYLNGNSGLPDSKAIEKEEKAKNSMALQPVGYLRGTGRLTEANDRSKKKETTDFNESLIRSMNDNLDEFIKEIKESPVYQALRESPFSEQMVRELTYFSRIFDRVYRYDWKLVLDKQLRDGYIFTKEKQENDRYAALFEEFGQMVNNSIVHAEVPRNIG